MAGSSDNANLLTTIGQIWLEGQKVKKSADVEHTSDSKNIPDRQDIAAGYGGQANAPAAGMLDAWGAKEWGIAGAIGLVVVLLAFRAMK